MTTSDWITVIIGGPPSLAILWAALRVLPRRFSTIERRLDKQDAQLDSIEHEIHTNSGSSLKDAVIRVETRLTALDDGYRYNFERIDRKLDLL